jgi:hypothetical protein
MAPLLSGAVACPPALGRLLRYAESRQLIEGDEADVWGGLFSDVPEPGVPVAALSALGEGMDTGTAYWMRADPVHLQLQRDSFLLDQVIAFQDPAQAQALALDFNQVFSADGMTLVLSDGQRWYLRLEKPPAVVTVPVAMALGRDINDLLPHGGDALHWHRVLTEIQMLLHTHPINAMREAHGDSPVNSLWFWGGGILPQHMPQRPDLAVWANDALMRGLAHVHGCACNALPGSPQFLQDQPALNHVVVLDALCWPFLGRDVELWAERLQQLDHAWFEGLLQTLRSGKISTLTLYLSGGGGVWKYELTRWSFYKFWRGFNKGEVRFG